MQPKQRAASAVATGTVVSRPVRAYSVNESSKSSLKTFSDRYPLYYDFPVKSALAAHKMSAALVIRTPGTPIVSAVLDRGF